MLTCPRSSLSFHSNAHHHGSLPQQLGVVWDLLLKADPEGPSLISHAAVRHRFHFALIRYMCLCSTLWRKNPAPSPGISLTSATTAWRRKATSSAHRNPRACTTC